MTHSPESAPHPELLFSMFIVFGVYFSNPFGRVFVSLFSETVSNLAFAVLEFHA